MRTLSSRFPRSQSKRRHVQLAAGLAFGATLGTTLFAVSDASASGYLAARFGADQGTPATPNTFAVYFNPAALGGTTGTTITGDVAVILRSASYQRPASALSPSNPGQAQDVEYRKHNVGKATLLNLLALPFVGVNTDFGGSKYFRGGYAAYIPFGGLATWDRRSPIGAAPGTSDGPQRWHNISGQILAIYNTLAFAVKVHPRFTIGANVSAIIHQVKTVRARNADGSDDTVTPGGLVEGRSLLEAHGFNMSAALGVYWEPTDRWRFGLSYTSQPGFGETKMNGTLETQIAAAKPGAPDKIDFLQTYPDVVRFGASVKATERLELKGDIEYIRWSVFDRQCVVKEGTPCNVENDGRAPVNSQVILNVPRNWKDAFGIRVGPAYAITDELELFGSASVTSPAVPKETIDASTIDAYRLYGTVGARYLFSRHFAMAAAYTHIYFFQVNTEGKSIQNIKDHPATDTANGGGQYNASRSPSADGTYNSQVGFVNINAAYTF